MTNNTTSLLNDEILRFLYSNAAFQSIEEKDQQTFLQTFQENEFFKEIVEIAIALQESIEEVEAFLPKMQNRDHLLVTDAHINMMKNRTKVEGNVYYVPFGEVKKSMSPFIVCLQQSGSMLEYEAFSKGMLLPFFHLCAHQNRDLIIIPFGEGVKEVMTFEDSTFKMPVFQQFIENMEQGEARIAPALEMAIVLLEEDAIKQNPDIMIVTDNQFTDFDVLLNSEFEDVFAELNAEISVMAMSEIDFEVQPIPFADKVFFANE